MNWVPVITAIATVAGALGIAYAVFTSARVQSTINLYKEENTAQGKRITTLEGDNRLALEKLEAMRRENDMLRDLATGRTAIEALAADIRVSNGERAAEHQALMESQQGILKALEAIERKLAAA